MCGRCQELPGPANALAWQAQRGRRTSKMEALRTWPTTSTCKTRGSCTNLQGSASRAPNEARNETVHGARKTWRSSRPQSSGFSKTTPTGSSNKDLTNRRIKAVEDAGFPSTNAARSFNPEYGVRAAAAGRGLMTVRSTKGRELALPAPQTSGGRQGGVSSCQAAGQLPGACTGP